MGSPGLLDRIRAGAPFGVGAALAGSSVIHTVRPGVFRPLVPRWLPGHPDLWVRVSGVVEGVAGVGLLTRAPWAGRLGAAVLLAIWPGNVQMALDSGQGKLPAPLDNRVTAWARVPLQVPLVWAAMQSRPRGVTTRSVRRAMAR